MCLSKPATVFRHADELDVDKCAWAKGIREGLVFRHSRSTGSESLYQWNWVLLML